MNRKLFGYNRKQVDEYIESINKDYLEKECEIRSKIEKSRSEKNKLLEEFQTLNSEKESWNEKKEYLELALERTQKAEDLLLRLSEDDIREIMELSKKRLSSYDGKISDILNETEHIRKNLDELLKIILGLLDERDEETDTKAAHETAENLKCKILPYIAKNTDKNAKSADSSAVKHMEKEEPEKKQERIEEVEKVEEIKERESFWELGKEEKVTADGAQIQNVPAHFASLRTMPYKDKPVHEKGHDDFTVEKTVKPSLVSKVPRITTEEGTAGGFWEDINEYTVQPVRPISAKEQLSASLETTDATSKESFSGETNEKRPLQSVVKEASSKVAAKQSQLVSPALDNPLPEGANAQISDSKGTVKSSPAISMEIDAIRQRYIVGKLAGEDLWDSNGSLIIAKSQVITPEVIKKAEQEGRLSELIINMILPGME